MKRNEEQTLEAYAPPVESYGKDITDLPKLLGLIEKRLLEFSAMPLMDRLLAFKGIITRDDVTKDEDSELKGTKNRKPKGLNRREQLQRVLDNCLAAIESCEEQKAGASEELKEKIDREVWGQLGGEFLSAPYRLMFEVFMSEAFSNMTIEAASLWIRINPHNISSQSANILTRNNRSKEINHIADLLSVDTRTRLAEKGRGGSESDFSLSGRRAGAIRYLDLQDLVTKATSIYGENEGRTPTEIGELEDIQWPKWFERDLVLALYADLQRDKETRKANPRRKSPNFALRYAFKSVGIEAGRGTLEGFVTEFKRYLAEVEAEKALAKDEGRPPRMGFL